MFRVTINKSPPLWKSQLPNQFTIVTTDSPKVPGRRWYSSLFSTRDSLHSPHKTMNVQKCNFFLLTFSHRVALARLPTKGACGSSASAAADASPFASLPLSIRDYQEEKNGRLQWKVCVKALPSVTTRPCPPVRLRSTTTRGICTSWMGLFPSFSAWVRFNTCRQKKGGRNMKIPCSVREQRRDGACVLVYLL